MRLNSPDVSADRNLVTDLYQLPPELRIIDTRDGVEQANRLIQRSEIRGLLDESGLDLYLVNPEAEPPVYKLLDYGKFKYDEQRKQRELQRRQRETTRTVKEIFFSPGIGEHDIETKVQHVRRLIDDYDVKVVMALNKKHKFLLTTRWSKPLHAVLNSPTFVLNRVLEMIAQADLAQPAKLVITDSQAYAMLRKKSP